MLFLLKEMNRQLYNLPNQENKGGVWVGQLDEYLILDFNSGHDPRVAVSSPTSGPVLSVETAGDSPSPTVPSLLMLFLSL